MLQGLLGELYTPEIAAKIGDKKLAVVNDGSYIPREKLKEATDKAKELEKQLTERDKQLETLKTAAIGNEELQKQIDTLKADNQKAKEGYEATLKQQAKDFAIDRAIAEAKGRNPKAIKALLDAEKVSIDGENVIGLKEQMEAIAKSDPYLFGDTAPGQIGGGANPPGGGNTPPDANEQYEQAMKAGNVGLAIAIKNKILGI